MKARMTQRASAVLRRCVSDDVVHDQPLRRNFSKSETSLVANGQSSSMGSRQHILLSSPSCRLLLLGGHTASGGELCSRSHWGA